MHEVVIFIYFGKFEANFTFSIFIKICTKLQIPSSKQDARLKLPMALSFV